MIKANELRIGNLVEGKDGVILPVVAFAVEAVNGDNRFGFNPIPLTPEILEKCGFEKNGCFYNVDNFQLMYGYTREEGKFFHFCLDEIVAFPPFKYLHELQNLYFALTGKELNVNNI